jgi:phenylacetate-CoA ligase
MFWNQQVETLAKSDMKAWQHYKIAKVIERVYEKSILYKERFDECGVKPEDVTKVDELARIPVTTFQDIANNYPYGLLTMPVSGVSYIHKNQEGALANTAISYTKNDMNMWAELISRLLVAGGVNMTSIFQILSKTGECNNHYSMQYGVQQTGATWVTDASNIGQQIQEMQDFGVTAVYSRASHLMDVAHEAKKGQVNLAELPLQVIFCDSQSITTLQKKDIREIYEINPREIYGLQDLWGMAIAGECHCQEGLHIQEDCFYAEVVHPISGQSLSMGEVGELVLTSLTLEAMPLVRYSTGILCSLDDNPCACGRTLVRMKKK